MSAASSRGRPDRRQSRLALMVGLLAFSTIVEGQLPLLPSPTAISALLTVLVVLYGWHVFRQDRPASLATHRHVAFALLLFGALTALQVAFNSGVVSPARHIRWNAQWAQSFLVMAAACLLRGTSTRLRVCALGQAGIVFLALTSLTTTGLNWAERSGVDSVNLNRQGYYYALGAIGAVAMLAKGNLDRRIRLCEAAALLLCVLALLGTASRGALFALIAGIAAQVVLRRRRRVRLIAVVTVCVLVGFVAFGASGSDLLIIDRVAAINEGDDGLRPELVDRASDLLKANAAIGLGGQYTSLLGPAFSRERVATHNSLMQAGLSFGLLGVMAITFLIAAIFARLLSRLAEPECAMYASLLIVGTTAGLFADMGFSKVFWIVAGLSAAAGQANAPGLAGVAPSSDVFR